MYMNNKQFSLNPALSASLLITAILAGCGSDSEPKPSPATPQSQEYYGIWERTGYGDVYSVSSTGADLYQYTRNGCLLAETQDNAELAELFTAPKISADGTTLITNADNFSAFEVRLDRLATLPDACKADNLLFESTPTATFEHLWHTFNDHYAFFEKRGVDWQNQYALLRPEVSDNLTDAELFTVIEELLEPLDDGHIMLNTVTEIDGDTDHDFADLRGFNRLIVETFDDTQFTDFQAYANEIAPKFVQIRASYLDGGSTASAGGTNGQRVAWGTIQQQLGYLRIARMTDLSSDGNNSVEANVTAINDILQTALLDLQDTSALIIDVRGNKGGEDAVSLAIANHFTSETRLAVSKNARSYLGDTENLDALLNPATETPYLKPIAVLGASDTGSAAEIFLMAMSALPQVTLVGEDSHGILSAVLSKSLPNGWEVSLSNEVYRDYLGLNHEASGVPTDVEATPYSIEAIAQGKDFAIEAAVETLGF